MPIKDALWHPWLKECLAQQMREASVRLPLTPCEPQVLDPQATCLDMESRHV